ncbi:MAG: cardiolipin synthase, partial [Polyangiales bacterium]
WLFGRSRLPGDVLVRSRADVRSSAASKAAASYRVPFQRDSARLPAAFGTAEVLAGMPVTRGNKVELLTDGDATFDSIFDGIAAAKAYILVQFYIVRDDTLGQRLQQHLLAKAKQGVRVYFLYDEIGSIGLSARYKTRLRTGGVALCAFRMRNGPSKRIQLNFRNHRKVVVVDGHITWIGGNNVGDEYLGKDPDIGAWHDAHVRIEGPAAMQAQVSFAEDWHWAAGQTLALDWRTRFAPDESDADVLVVPSGPTDELETAGLLFVHAIHAAQRRLWIASPYFIPDPAVIAALQLAALRGVDVRILVPERPDSLSVHLAAYAYFATVVRTGVQIYRHREGLLHKKVALIDEQIAIVGTANFDNRSFRLNFEITALIADPTVFARLEVTLAEDFQRAFPLDRNELDQKPWHFRFCVQCARLVAPLL